MRNTYIEKVRMKKREKEGIFPPQVGGPSRIVAPYIQFFSQRGRSSFVCLPKNPHYEKSNFRYNFLHYCRRF